MRKSKMQKIIISSVVALSSLAAMGQSNVSNIRVQTMDHVLIIQYDLATRADIEVFASFDGGVNFTGPLQHVTGEAGRGIEPGRDKIIIWNVRNELGAMDNPNTVIKVVSTNEAGAPRVVASTPSSSGALISRRGKVYQWDRQLNDSEFKRFMELKMYKGLTPLSEENVQFLMASTSEFAWAVYNKGVKNHKIGGWLMAPCYITGIALQSNGNVHIREAVAMHNDDINRNDLTQMMFNYNFEIGKKRNRTGNIFLYSGIGLGIAGFPLYSMYSEYYVFGILCWYVGTAMILTSIPLKIHGKHLMRQPAALQSSGSNRAGLEMDVSIRGNGAGLSLRF